MNSSSYEIAYKCTKTLIVFAVVLFLVVAVIKSRANTIMMQNKQRQQSQYEQVLKNKALREQREAQLEAQRLEEEKQAQAAQQVNTPQDELNKAQQRISNVQMQMAKEEEPQNTDSQAGYMENSENFELQQNNNAQILNEAPGTILIEPAD